MNKAEMKRFEQKTLDAIADILPEIEQDGFGEWAEKWSFWARCWKEETDPIRDVRSALDVATDVAFALGNLLRCGTHSAASDAMHALCACMDAIDYARAAYGEEEE
jgi:hypothetical protein